MNVGGHIDLPKGIKNDRYRNYMFCVMKPCRQLQEIFAFIAVRDIERRAGGR